MPVVHRVTQILDDLAAIIAEGPEREETTGYAFLRDYGLDTIIGEFVAAKGLYGSLVRPPTGLDYLNEIERVLAEIGELNRGIAYAEARMKHSADEEEEQLRRKCREFGKYHRLFRKATIPLA